VVGPARHDEVRSGEARPARSGKAMLGEAWPSRSGTAWRGLAVKVRQGAAWPGAAWPARGKKRECPRDTGRRGEGPSRRVRRVQAGLVLAGMARPGLAWQGGRGRVWFGVLGVAVKAWQGMACRGRSGRARRVLVGHGRQGGARLGWAGQGRQGLACPGAAGPPRLGSARPVGSWPLRFVGARWVMAVPSRFGHAWRGRAGPIGSGIAGSVQARHGRPGLSGWDQSGT
jgi:hypothetical protein